MLVAGGFTLLTALLLGKGLLAVLGGLNLLIGLGWLSRPIFVVHEDRVELKNLLGMTMKTHQFSGLAELEVRGKKLFRRGERKALAGSGLVHSADWERVVAAVDRATSS